MKNVETDDLKIGEILVINCPSPPIPDGGSIISQFINSASSMGKLNGYIVGILAIDLPYAVIVPFYDSSGVRIKGTPLAVNVSNIRFAKPSQDFVSIMSQNKMNSLTFDVTEYKGVRVNTDLVSSGDSSAHGDSDDDNDDDDGGGFGDTSDLRNEGDEGDNNNTNTDPYSDDI